MNSEGAHRKWRVYLDVTVSLVLLAAAGAVLYRTQWNRVAPVRNDPPVPSALQIVTSDGARGSSSAPATLIVYSEFQCRFCARFASEVLPALDERYVKKDRLLIAFRHFPPASRPAAFLSATVAACAGSAFWQAHDVFFANQASLSGADLPTIIRLAGLDERTITPCLESQGPEHVKSDIASGRELQIRSTPTFLVGVRVAGGVKVKRVIVGAKPLDEFIKVIDSVLEAK